MAARRKTPLPEAEWWSVNEEAAEKKVHPLTIRRAINRGDIIAMRIGTAIRVLKNQPYRKKKPPVRRGRPVREA